MRITRTDKEKERSGVWTDYEGVKMLVARSTNNPRYETAVTKAIAPYSDNNTGRKQKLTADKSKHLMIKVLANQVLLDWETFEDADGISQEYTVDAAIKLLTEDGDCRDFITNFAGDIDNYMKEEDVAGK